MIEFDMNWLKGRDYVEVTFPPKTREKNLLLRMAEEGVEGVTITAQNKDGSVVGHVPLSCVLFRRPKKHVEMSAAEKAQRCARLSKFLGAKTSKTDESETDDDLPFEPEIDGFWFDDNENLPSAEEVIGYDE